MKKNRTIWLSTLLLTFMVILGYIILQGDTSWSSGLNLIIFSLIIILAIIALAGAYRKDQKEKQGFPTEDELSNRLKYKSGYFAYMASMYMWLFIFLFREKFPDTELMLGGGILLSGVIALISKVIIKHSFNE